MKKTIIKTLLVVFASFSFFLSQAQWKDSSSYKQSVIQLYKQQTTGIKTYQYIPKAYTQQEQDTLFKNALTWKKETIDHPMILNYFHLQKGTPDAQAKIQYLEDTASKKEYAEVMNKAGQLYASQHKEQKQKNIAPGLTTPRSKSRKILNNDKEIADKVLKNWKP